MLAGKKVLVVMPAYNAARTLERTFQDIPFDVVDEGDPAEMAVLGRAVRS